MEHRGEAAAATTPEAVPAERRVEARAEQAEDGDEEEQPDHQQHERRDAPADPPLLAREDQVVRHRRRDGRPGRRRVRGRQDVVAAHGVQGGARRLRAGSTTGHRIGCSAHGWR
jgi:hypothetical protein